MSSKDGRVMASARGLTALGTSLHPTKVRGEGTNPCTQSSFGTKNEFHRLQDVSKEIRESPRLQLDAAARQ